MAPGKRAGEPHPVRSRSRFVAYMRLGDLAAAVAAVAWVDATDGANAAVFALLAALALLTAWSVAGVYDRAVGLDIGCLLRRLAAGAAVAAALLAAAVVLLDLPFGAVRPTVWAGAALASVAAAARMILGTVAARWREAGEFSRLIVVVGTADGAARYIETAIADGDNVVGVFAPDAAAVGGTFAGRPVIGSFADIPHHPALAHVDRIAVAGAKQSDAGGMDAAEMIHRLRSFPGEVDLVLAAASDPQTDASPRGRAAAVPILVRPLAGGEALAKEWFDRIAGVLLLILLLPVLGVIALAIRLETPGPALFRQPRPGLGTTTVGVFKFRTMRGIDPMGTIETAVADPRVTRVGRFLRRYRLDELPQLINVAVGEMSLVGPRPLPPLAHLDHGVMGDILTEHARRRAVRPGLTGWAQVNGHMGPCRTVDSLQRRIALDLEYINRWSFWLDIEILWRTIWVLLRRKGDSS